MTPGTKTVPATPLRCPSCAHANPASANFCNHCGMPVNLEPCRFCEAINKRGDAACHKCGILLARPVEAAPEMATEMAGSRADTVVERRAAPATPTPRAEPRPPVRATPPQFVEPRPPVRETPPKLAEPRPPVRETPPAFDPPRVDAAALSMAAASSGDRREPTVGVESVRRVEAVAVENAEDESAAPARNRAHVGRIAVLLVLLAVVGAAGYFAARDPARVQDAIEVIRLKATAIKLKADAALRMLTRASSPAAVEAPAVAPQAEGAPAPQTPAPAPASAPASAPANAATASPTVDGRDAAANTDSSTEVVPAAAAVAPAPPSPASAATADAPMGAPPPAAEPVSAPATPLMAPAPASSVVSETKAQSPKAGAAQRAPSAKSSRQSSARSGASGKQGKSTRRESASKGATTRNRAKSAEPLPAATAEVPAASSSSP